MITPIVSSVSLLLAAIAAAYFIDQRRRQQQKHALLPPGPPDSPHGRQCVFPIPFPREWCTQKLITDAVALSSPPQLIQSWIEQYGPIISLKQGGHVLVIIGRHNVRLAHALLVDLTCLTAVNTMSCFLSVIFMTPSGGDTALGKTRLVLCGPPAFGGGKRHTRSGHAVHAAQHVRSIATVAKVRFSAPPYFFRMTLIGIVLQT